MTLPERVLELVLRGVAWVVVTPFVLLYRVLDWCAEKMWNS